MSKWGSQWGTNWGCEVDEPNKVDTLCDLWLFWQYDRAENMQALCKIFAEIFTELEDKAQFIQATIGVDQASGGELDAWASLVDIVRDGVTDNLLRRKIKAAARAAFGAGQARDFFDVMILIAPNSNPTFAEVFPACVRMFFSTVTESEIKIIFELMQQVPGLGICLQFVEIDPSGQVFEFSYLESDVGIVPRQTFPIQWHWDFSPDLDIPPNQKAGFAFLLEA